MKQLFALLLLSQFITSFGQVKTYRLDAFVELHTIQKIEVLNNKGRHIVSPAKLEKLKKELGKMTSGHNAVKVGAKQIIIWIKQKKYYLSGATNGSTIEVPSSIATKNKKLLPAEGTLYFNANGLNIDNY